MTSPAATLETGTSTGLRVATWLLPVVAVAAVYLQVHDHMFIEFDDMYYTFENPIVIQGLTWDGIVWAFSGSHVANYHPLTWLSHMLDYTLFGNSSGAFALTNAALHAINAALVARLLTILFGSRVIGLVAGLLFAVHPVLVEGVAWISQRKTLLSTAFALGTVLFYVRSSTARTPRAYRLAYGLSLVCFTLSLLAKGMYVTMPALLLLMEATRGTTDQAPRAIGIRTLVTLVQVAFIRLAPYVALAVVASGVTIWAQAGDNAVQSLEELSLANRLATAGNGYLAYASHFFAPVGLSVFYPGDPDWGWSEAATSWTMLALITGLLGWAHKWDRGVALLGWLTFGVLLLPVIGLVQVGSQAMADRYMYGPIIGLIIAGLSLIRTAYSRIERPSLQLMVHSTVGAWILWLGVLGHGQVRHWHNSYSLAESSLRSVGPEPQLLAMKAVILLRAREYEAALAACDQALTLAPDCFPALQNKAICQDALGNTAGAVQTSRTLVVLRPDDPAGWANLALYLSKTGSHDEAHAIIERLRLDPDLTPSVQRLLESLESAKP